MSRRIPVALQANLDSATPSVTRCIRIQKKDGTALGVTMWDTPVVYDHGDGWGEIEYSAQAGVDASDIMSDIGYSVSNAEGRILAATNNDGLTPEAVEAGELDDAEWTCFLLDPMNPSPGSAAILDAGDIGEVRVERGLVIIPELLSYMMRLQQPVGHVFQRPCRAIFGTPPDSQTGCGVNAEALWAAGQVVSVGAESDRTFTGEFDGWFPGRLEFLTGPNVGKRYAIESVSGATLSLADTTPYLIGPGDLYRHRPDCTKLPNGTQGCKFWGNYLNYKGEDNIPSGDGAAGSTPGAQLPGGGGFVGKVPADTPSPGPIPDPLPELIATNPGFEEGLEGWSVDPSPVIPIAESFWEVETDPALVYEGAASLRWTGDTSDGYGGYAYVLFYKDQKIEMPANPTGGPRSVRIRMQVRAMRDGGPDGFSTAGIGLASFTSAGVRISEKRDTSVVLVGDQADSGWRDVSVSFQADAEAAYYKVFVHAQALAGRTMLFDSLEWDAVEPLA